MEHCGLVVNPSLPWLGASPDGIYPLEPSIGLLEIKCPYTHHLLKVEDAATDHDSSFFAEPSNGKVTLVQGQMALAKVPWCDLV